MPGLDIGTHFLRVTVGNSTVTALFTVAPAAGGTPVAEAFAPLGSNLLWVAYFDPNTLDLSVYDPSNSFSVEKLSVPFTLDPSSIGNLTHVVAGGIYYVSANDKQTVTLGGRPKTLVKGITIISW